MSQSTPVSVEPISYAMPGAQSSPRVAASVVIIMCGLALIVFGGCFMLGILIQLNVETIGSGHSATLHTDWIFRDYVFHGVLYLLAFGCFTSGGLRIWRTVVSLGRHAWDGQTR